MEAYLQVKCTDWLLRKGNITLPTLIDECIEALLRIKKLYYHWQEECQFYPATSDRSCSTGWQLLHAAIHRTIFWSNGGSFLLWWNTIQATILELRSKIPSCLIQLFYFRLQRFHLDLRLQRLRLKLTKQPHWFPNSLRTNNLSLVQRLKPPWKVPASALPALLPSSPIPNN